MPEFSPTSAGYHLVRRNPNGPTSLVPVGGVELGGDFVVIAGPCAIESREQALTCAEAVKAFGGHMLRGGAFKPRTSPYSFQGMGMAGVGVLTELGATHGLPTVSEVMAPQDVPLLGERISLLQVGSRNMQNFPLLEALGKSPYPVLLKRGMGATVDEWLYAAEYVLSQGNRQVVLCERGIRTFEPRTRNTLDLSSVALAKRLTHLPVLVDPSHATGDRELVLPMALAAAAAGADGVMVEIHPTPETALSDGPQALNFSSFEMLMSRLRALLPSLGRRLATSP